MKGLRSFLSLAPWAALTAAMLLSQAHVLQKRLLEVEDAPLVVQSSTSEQVVQIAISGKHYIPAQIRVSRGATVVWSNQDDSPHTVTSTDGSWGSGEIQPGGTFRYTFEDPGPYSYFCVRHPDMLGAVTVSGR
jgi:plastocyanin